MRPQATGVSLDIEIAAHGNPRVYVVLPSGLSDKHIIQLFINFVFQMLTPLVIVVNDSLKRRYLFFKHLFTLVFTRTGEMCLVDTRCVEHCIWVVWGGLITHFILLS